MAKFLETKSLGYDDVNLIAQPQNVIKHRSEVPRELHRIIVAPMEAVVGEELAQSAATLGLTVCIPRVKDAGKQIAIMSAAVNGARNDCFGKDRVYVAVGLNDYKRVKALGCDYVLIDVANGYLAEAVEMSRNLQHDGYHVMVGNVHTATGYNLYAGCKVRVGIAGGLVCQTSIATGYTRGQITELQDVVKDKWNNTRENSIVADGGINSSGCAAKAFGIGSDFVMMGGVFSRAKEAQSIVDGRNIYFGGASVTAQILQYGEKRRHSEGRTVQIDPDEIRPLKDIVEDFWGGLASAVSYSGYGSLTQFIGNGVFEVKGR